MKKKAGVLIGQKQDSGMIVPDDGPAHNLPIKGQIVVFR